MTIRRFLHAAIALGLTGPSCAAIAGNSDIIFESGFEFPSPLPGEFVITEIMANPAAVSNANGEWFEVVNTSPSHRNVNACVVTNGNTSSTTLPSRDVAPQEFLLFARTSDPNLNGGLPTPTFQFTFALVNTNGVLTLECNGQVIDAISWSTSVSGHSRSLDPDFFDASANDDAGVWCTPTLPYGQGDFGTPGTENPQCQ